MDSPQLSTPANAQPPGHSATVSDPTSSPALSFFSKGYSARSGSSGSSIASSPVPRESVDGLGIPKRLLEDVTEEPHEREHDFDTTDSGSPYFCMLQSLPRSLTVPAANHFTVDDCQPHALRDSLDRRSRDSTSQTDYEFDCEMASEKFSPRPSSKKQRSGEFSLPGVAGRLGTRFPSLSKRWKHKSAAGPQLSIITHADHIGSRTGSAGSSQPISPALSVISKRESYLPPSPVRTNLEDSFNDAISSAFDIDKQAPQETEEQGQARTPLLPPLMMDFSTKNAPIQSPLQSPSVAEITVSPVSTTPVCTPQLYTLPSPPLSTKPSVASMQQRSRAGTTTMPPAEIPPMQMLDEPADELSRRLGHANFTIEPEPYLPDLKDIESYRRLRVNWDVARYNYGKHLARTGENFGTTSNIYLWTQEKWAAIDAEWKRHNDTMAKLIEPMIVRLSDGDTDQGNSTASSAVLEKPITKVIVPQIDDPSGKFPRLGDEDIVGPMAFAPNRSQQADVEPAADNRGSRKRSFFKYISDILGRSYGVRP